MIASKIYQSILLAAATTLMISCSSSSSSDDETIYAVGDRGPAGGIVFYVTDGGLRGLEASPTDIIAEWGCEGIDINGADGSDIGTGAQNTSDILGGCASANIAAEVADDYSINGFSDWFLPSANELGLMYIYRAIIGGFGNAGYWSSTESSSTESVYVEFSNGAMAPTAPTAPTSKSALHNARPIRAF